MTRARPLRILPYLPLAIMLSLPFSLVGCGSDDNSPTRPPSSEFDELLAADQAAFAAPLAVAMLENIAAFAQGVGGKDYGYTFVYDATRQLWVATTTYDEEGYAFNYVYTVQYRDAEGDPQPGVEDAASMRFTEDGSANFSYSGDGMSLVMNFEFASDVTAGGLSTGTLLINGGGGYDMDYDITNDGRREVFDLAIGWQTLANGIGFPADGCPTGAMRFSLSPYTFDLTFDGTNTVNYVMRDGSGNLVPDGSGSEIIDCGG